MPFTQASRRRPQLDVQKKSEFVRASRVLSPLGVIALVVALSISIPVPPVGAAARRSTSPVAKAHRALLTIADMPAGWTWKPSSNSGSNFPGAAQMAHCLGVPTSVVSSSPPSANSRQFYSPNGLLSVSDSVSIYPTAQAAAVSHAAFASPKAPSCLAAALNGPAKAQLERGDTKGEHVGTISVLRKPSSYFAAGGVNAQVVVPVVVGGLTVRTLITIVDYVKGPEDQTVTFTAVISADPVSLTRRLTALAKRRI